MKLQLVNGHDFSDMVIETKEIPPGCKIPVPPKIYITDLARAKIHALARFTLEEIGDLEVFTYLVGEEMGKVIDIVVPHVEVTGGYGEVTPENIKTIKPEIAAKNERRMAENEERKKRNAEIAIKNVEIKQKNIEIGKLNEVRKDQGLDLLPEEEEIPLLRELKPLLLIGWAHSHVKFNVFSSPTDDQQHANLHRELRLSKLMDQVYDPVNPKMFHVVGITVNVFGEEYGVVKGSLVCGLELRQWERVEILPLDEYQYAEEEIMEELKKLKVEVKQKVHLLRDRFERKPRYIQPVKQKQPAQPSRVTTLEKFLDEANLSVKKRIRSESDLTLVQAIKEKITVRDIKNDGQINNEMEQLQRVYKNKPKTLELVTKIYNNIIARSYEIIMDGIENVANEFNGVDEQGTSEESNEDECAECGAAINEFCEENFDDDGGVLCPECYHGKYGDERGIYCSNKSCNKRLNETEKRYTDGSGNTLCEDCFSDYVKENDPDSASDDEATGDTSFDFFDDDGNAKKCVQCEEYLLLGENFEDDYNEDGFPLCTKCAAKNTGDVTGTGKVNRDRDDPQYIS